MYPPASAEGIRPRLANVGGELADVCAGEESETTPQTPNDMPMGC